MVVKCLQKEFKSDIVHFLRNKAKYRSDDDKLAKELYNLADVIQNRIALCTGAGNPSGPWLRRHGYTKDDLVMIGNIIQVVDDD